MKRRSFIEAASCGALPYLVTPLAHAENSVSRPVKVVVAWPAGGFVDVVVRAVTEKLASDTGTPFIVDNKPGAYGLIGAEQVIQSLPDGKTWLIGTLGTPMSASLYKRKWIAADELAGVAMVANSPLIGVVPVTLPASNFKEFIALARSQPGKLNYLNPSIGSASHLNTELIKKREGVSITSVLYNGQPPGVMDLLAGQTHFGLLAPQVAAPHIRTGKLRAIGVAFPSRLREFPNVPTLAEEGYQDAQVVASYTVLVPKKTPKDLIARFNAQIQKALGDEEVRRRIDAAGAVVAGSSTPEQVDAFLRAETLRWDSFFRETNISID